MKQMQGEYDTRGTSGFRYYGFIIAQENNGEKVFRLFKGIMLAMQSSSVITMETIGLLTDEKSKKESAIEYSGTSDDVLH